MTSKQKKILECLSKNSTGLKASEIAEKLNITRREVNQFLYYEQTDYVNTGEPYYKWVKKTGAKPQSSYAASLIKKSDPVLSKLNNQGKAKVFTSRYFNALADWRVCKTHTGKKAIGTYRTKTGNLIDYDSEPELQLLKYLNSSSLIAEIGAQNLEVSYDTAFRFDKPYYPDFIVLKKDGHIAIIESKSIMAMSYHKNIEKYNSLKNFCVARGYEYMMIAPDYNYMTFDELSKLRVPISISSQIEAYLRNLLGQDGERLLEPSDVPILYEDFENVYDKKEFELYLHAFVIQKGWYNKYSNGFMVFEKPQKTER